MTSFRFVLLMAGVFLADVVHAQESIQPGCDERSAKILQECSDAMGGMSLESAANLKLSGKLSAEVKAGETEFIVNADMELVMVGLKSLATMTRQDSVFKRATDGSTMWTSQDGRPFQEQGVSPNPPDWTPWPGYVMAWEDLNQITFDGEEDVDGRPCWKLQFEHVQGHKSVRLFDKATGLPVQFRYENSNVGETRTTFGFVQYEEWKLPLKQSIRIDLVNGGTQTSEVEYEVTEFGFDDEDAGFSIPPKQSDQ